MTAPLLWSPYFKSYVLSGVQLESVRNEASKLGRLHRGSAWEFWFSFVGPLPIGVVFFPSPPFMGVVLSPSFVLGDVSGEGGTLLVLLSLFSPLLSLPLLSSPSPSLSFSLLFFLLFFLISFSIFSPSHSPFFLSFRLSLPLFLTHKLFPSIFSSSPLFHLVFLSSFFLEGFFFFFLRELLVLFVSKM